MRSKGTSPRSSRMNSVEASSRSSDELRARAQRLAASRRSARRPSSSRSSSASSARRSTFCRSRWMRLDEPADEAGHDQAGACLKSDVVGAERGVEEVGAPMLEPDRDRHVRERGHDAADHAVPDRAGDDSDQEELPRRRSLLEREEDDERAEDREVENHRDRGVEARRAVADGGEEHDCADSERRDERPRRALVGGRQAGRQRDLQHRERHGREAHDADPPLERMRTTPHARSSTRASDHEACSASIGSSSSA